MSEIKTRDEEDYNDVTPVEEPIAENLLNRPYVMTLHNLSVSLMAKVRVLDQIAIGIGQNPNLVHEITRGRIADTLDEASSTIKLAADEMRK